MSLPCHEDNDVVDGASLVWRCQQHPSIARHALPTFVGESPSSAHWSLVAPSVFGASCRMRSRSHGKDRPGATYERLQIK